MVKFICLIALCTVHVAIASAQSRSLAEAQLGQTPDGTHSSMMAFETPRCAEIAAFG
jgi:hypothetical protein